MCRVKKRLFTANVLWYWSSRRSSFIQAFLIFLRNNLVSDKITNMRNFQTKNHKELSNRTPKSSSFNFYRDIWHSISISSLSFLRYCLCAIHWNLCQATLTPFSSTISLRLTAHWKVSSSREGPERLVGVSCTNRKDAKSIKKRMEHANFQGSKHELDSARQSLTNIIYRKKQKSLLWRSMFIKYATATWLLRFWPICRRCCRVLAAKKQEQMTNMGSICRSANIASLHWKAGVPLSFTRHVLMCRVKKCLFTSDVLWYWSSRRSSFIQAFLIFLRNNLVSDKITNMRNFQTKNHKELSNRTPKSSSFNFYRDIWHSISISSLSFLRYCLCAIHWNLCQATLTPLFFHD